MSTMMTFEYLSHLCQNKEQVFSQPSRPKDSRGGQNFLQLFFSAALLYHHLVLSFSSLFTLCFKCFLAAEAVVTEDGIHMVPFQFDLIQLLPKCQQVELFFLTFSTGSPPFT